MNVKNSSLNEKQITNTATQHKKRVTITVVLCTCLAVLVALVLYFFLIPNAKYKKAVSYLDSKQYFDAIDIFGTLGEFKNSNDLLKESKYCYALQLLDDKDYHMALVLFRDIRGYRDTEEYISNFEIQYTSEEKYYKDDLEIRRVYDSNGKLIEIESGNSNTYYKYDDTGFMIEKTYIGKHRIDSVSKTTSVYTYFYDKNGNCVKEKCNEYGEDAGKGSTYYFTYDANGNKIHEKYVCEFFTSNTYYTYDDNGNLTEERKPPYGNWKGNTTTYSYDSYGNVIEMETVYSDGTSNRYTYTYVYDDNGNMIEEKKFADANNLLKHYRYVYDNQWNMIEKHILVHTGDPEKKIYYTYDELGNIQRSSDGDKYTYTGIRVVYHPHKNVS